MAQTQTTCPKCRQPVLVEVQQSFDMTQDPLAKQKLLSNAANVMHCPSCGYQGMLAVPIVYHDPDKELLLTFFPPDLRTPVNEQERQIGPLIKRILDNLPQEKRKAYLLQPKSMLTYQTLIETILEADGITKEMLEAQQKRIMLLERLLTTPKENRLALVQQEEALFDMHFFSILSRILQSTMSQGDQNSQKELLDLQNLLFENTKVGKEIYTQAKESESVIKALQEAGKEGLTREKLLDVILAHTSDIQLSTLVSMARSGMDYEFFKILSGKIDASSDEKEKKALTELREKLLQLTEQIDQRVKDELEKTRALLEKIVNSANIESALEENIESINEFFLQVLESEIAQARKNGNLDRITKLEQIMIFIEKSAQPTKEVQFLESLLDISEEAQLEKTLKENLDKINQEFLGLLNTLVAQSEGQSANAEIAEKLRKIYKTALRISMTANLGKA
ncbi:MAG: hypothetical protein HPY72_05880 [Anaerolineae bacterium]|nr:hypothetical protein [Anaerolineae bacterium]